MKKYISFLGIILGVQLGFSQSVIKTFSTTVDANYSLSTNQLSNIKKSNKKYLDLNNRLIINHINLNDGDLIVDYAVRGFRKKEQQMSLQLALSVIDTQYNYANIALPNTTGGVSILNFSKTTQTNKIIWENWVENIKPRENFIRLKLEGTLISPYPIDCREPRWTKKDKIPHYIGTLTGVTFFLIGELHFKPQSKDLQLAYIKLAASGFPPSTSVKYTEANSKYKLTNSFKEVGVVLTATSIISGAIRYFIYKKKQGNYAYYCQDNIPKVSFTPSIKLHNHPFSEIGLTIAYRF